MVIILLSGLSQAGTAWLRVAELNDPREYFRLRQNGWVGGRTHSLFTAPLEKTKQERSVLSQHGIYSPTIPSCACKYLHAVICPAQKKPILVQESMPKFNKENPEVSHYFQIKSSSAGNLTPSSQTYDSQNPRTPTELSAT